MSDDKTRILGPQFAAAGVGTQLSGIYELDERLASGGMGEVYRGHNIQTGDSVAIKIVLPEFANDQTILALFRKEASILNHLSHEAVVRYHVFTIDPGIGRPYLAMEFVKGESLFDVLRRGPMPTGEVCRLCHRLASGLGAVHEAGAIHRDLSPDNIILPDGRVERAKIIDFGIARSETVGGGTLIDGRFAGKYNYVSPEQLGLFGGQVSPQSDIYSLGLVLAAALRGKPIDMSGSQLDVVEKRRRVPDLSDIDGAFRPLLEAMLQPQPADRPESMAEIARMTRDGGVEAEGTRPPPVQRRAWEPPGGAYEAEASSAPAPTGGPRFVEHVRPSYLSGARPQEAPSAAGATPPAKTKRRTGTMVAAVATLAVMVGAAGAYFGGLIDLSAPKPPAADGAPAALTPAPDQPAKDEQAPPQAAETVAADQTAKADEAAVQPEQPANPEPAVKPEQDTAADRLADALAKLAERDSKATLVPGKETATPAAEDIKPEAQSAQQGAAIQPETSGAAAAAKPEAVEQGSPVSAEPVAGQQAAAEKVTDVEQAVAADVLEPKAEDTPAVSAEPSAGSTATETPRLAAQPADETVQGEEDAAPVTAANSGAASAATEERAPEAVADAPKAPQEAAQAEAANTAARAQETEAASGPAPETDSGEVVALNVPKPEIPQGGAMDAVAQRISWLEGYRGGDCFYASAIAATDDSIEIEGFGTAVDPFVELESAFQAKFNLEPSIDVRLIDPGQCDVTGFLRSLEANGAAKPTLLLDYTSIPDGGALSGVLRAAPGLKSSMLLIDHKGMMFNLDDRVVVAANQASFNIPIGLGDSDRSRTKGVPQIVLVVTGPQALRSAELSAPAKAADALPKMLSEIRERGGAFSATAKYFRLGG
ncbi:MAG: protein kinase [Rhizobiales bacterium]|nr:protein kinase [Hyphomicrobiales bacterium]